MSTTYEINRPALVKAMAKKGGVIVSEDDTGLVLCLNQSAWEHTSPFDYMVATLGYSDVGTRMWDSKISQFPGSEPHPNGKFYYITYKKSGLGESDDSDWETTRQGFIAHWRPKLEAEQSWLAKNEAELNGPNFRFYDERDAKELRGIIKNAKKRIKEISDMIREHEAMVPPSQRESFESRITEADGGTKLLLAQVIGGLPSAADPSYGRVWLNLKTGAVKYSLSDGDEQEMYDAWDTALGDVQGVTSVEGDAEIGKPKGDDWVEVAESLRPFESLVEKRYADSIRG